MLFEVNAFDLILDIAAPVAQYPLRMTQYVITSSSYTREVNKINQDSEHKHYSVTVTPYSEYCWMCAVQG